MKVSVLDSYALLAFLFGERGHETVLNLLERTGAALAKQRHAALYTGDPEFRQVEKEISIIWL